MKYKTSVIKKVNSLMGFIYNLDRLSKKSFEKYCKSKEIRL